MTYTAVQLAGMSLDQVRDSARAAGIQGVHSLTRPQLVEKLLDPTERPDEPDAVTVLSRVALRGIGCYGREHTIGFEHIAEEPGKVRILSDIDETDCDSLTTTLENLMRAVAALKDNN